MHTATATKSPHIIIHLRKRTGKGTYLIKESNTSGTLYYSSADRDKDLINFQIRVFAQYFAIEKKILLLHASSAVKNGVAYLFCGPSGAGKSTIAEGFPVYKILSHDTAVLKKTGDSFLAYTSPFDKKEQANYLPQKVKVSKIYFLQQARKTSWKKLTIVEALPHLLLQTVLFQNVARKLEIYFRHNLIPLENLPFYDRKEISQLLHKLYPLDIELLMQSSLYTLRFTKDLNFLKKL